MYPGRFLCLEIKWAKITSITSTNFSDFYDKLESSEQNMIYF